jgi:hypothetical protein
MAEGQNERAEARKAGELDYRNSEEQRLERQES